MVVQSSFLIMSKQTRNLNYYSVYLEKELRDNDDPRAEDKAWLDECGEEASAEFETRRLKDGMTVDQAHECAMKLLLTHIDNN